MVHLDTLLNFIYFYSIPWEINSYFSGKSNWKGSGKSLDFQ